MPRARVSSGATLPRRARSGPTASRTAAMSISWLKFQTSKGSEPDAGEQVGAGRVVVVDADEAVEGLEDPLQVRHRHRLEAAGREHPGDVVEEQDAEGLAEPLHLRAEEGEHDVGERVEGGVGRLGLAGGGLEERAWCRGRGWRG